jgi:hypothetical protein
VGGSALDRRTVGSRAHRADQSFEQRYRDQDEEEQQLFE